MTDARIDGRRRFAMIPEVLLSDASLPDSAVRVFGALHRFGKTPDTCYPSIARIAEAAGTNPSAVKKALNALERAGWIRRVERTTGRGLKASNGYEVHETAMGRNRTVVGSNPTHREVHKPRSLDGSESNRRWVDSDPPVRSDSTQPASRENVGVRPGRPDGSDSTQEREKEPLNERGSPRSLTSLATFEEFWNTYPHAVKRKAALAAWQHATRGVDVAEVVRGARAYAEYVIRTGEKPQFMEEPAAWLTRQGWTDRLDPPRPPDWLDNMPNQGRLTVSPEELGLTWGDMVDPNGPARVNGHVKAASAGTP